MLTALFLFAALMLYGFTEGNGLVDRRTISMISIAGVIYTVVIFILVRFYQNRQMRLRWIITLVNCMAIILMEIALSGDLSVFVGSFIILIGTVSGIQLGRDATYLFLFLAAAARAFMLGENISILSLMAHFSPFLLSMVILEVVGSLQESNRHHVGRLEMINHVGREIVSSIETEEVISVLNEAVRGSLHADTYYVAFLKENRFELSLLYDDGQYIQGQTVPTEGTLCGWILHHRQPLLLRNLPKENINYVIIGKNRISLSWLGVPLYHNEEIIGVIAVASYRKNMFDQDDLELMENLSQQASMALDNAMHHAEVELQSKLDSLTGVYNHAHFLTQLQDKLDIAAVDGSSISLIMMDVDFFKQYNDQYGHLVGDRVLTELIAAIRRHIKRSDIIGRWGGEEFAIALLKTDGPRALQVAARISDTMNRLTVVGRDRKELPAPTVSQGIAVFPDEAVEIFRLIDIADQRLYMAKERGRNQVEPGPNHWNGRRNHQAAEE